MLIDLRTYTTRPGGLQKQLEMYRDKGFDIQRRHQGEPLAFLVTESWPLNSYVHLWAYESTAHREQARSKLHADPQWKAYLAQSAEAGFLVSQENRLLVPVDFVPLQR
jgi:hypothetical protein